MKKYGILALIAAGSFIGCASAPKPDVNPKEAPVVQVQKDTLVSATDRKSYALGINVGRSLKDVLLTGIDLDIMQKGLKSQLDTSAKVLMTEEEIESTLQDLVKDLQAKREADAKALLQKTLEEQKAFLAKNAKDSGVVTTSSGLQYKIEKTADGIAPKREDKVKVHYKGSLLDGKEFDSSYLRGEPLEFPVSAVIEGWQELLTNMKVGMKVKAWIPSELGYGEVGATPAIPGNSLLIFEVELLEVQAANPPADTLNVAPLADSTQQTPAQAEVKTDSATTAPKAEPAKQEVKPAEQKAEPAKQEAKPAEQKAEPAKKEAKPAEKKGEKTEPTKTETKAQKK